jgi:hypothetical protein
MATLTINTTTQAPVGLTYVQNIARAARALLAALLTPPAARPIPAVRATKKVAARDDMALYRLYCLSSPYDSVMPSLAQELNAMACRDDSDR